MNSNCLLATLYHKFGIDFHKHYLRQQRPPGSHPDRWRADRRTAL